jgi:hypothetical protein
VGCTRTADAQEVIVILTRQFAERNHIFSRPQEEFWPKLGDQIPDHFILYGDTALGLRLGHRHAPDFEFKSARNFNPEYLLDNVPLLRDAKVLESRWSHLKVAVGGPNPVEMTFDGGQTVAQIHPVDRASNGLPVASLPDLAGEKMHKVSERPTEVDYRDVIALLYEGVTMDEMLGCAKAMYRERFDPSMAVWNLTSFDRSGVKLGPDATSTLIREGAQAQVPARTPIHSERITTETQEPAQRPRLKQNFERAVDPYDLRDPFDLPDLER